MRYGVSYYPEHKKPEEYQHDIRCIIESGINTVRMGEFVWCRIRTGRRKLTALTGWMKLWSIWKAWDRDDHLYSDCMSACMDDRKASGHFIYG